MSYKVGTATPIEIGKKLRFFLSSVLVLGILLIVVGLAASHPKIFSIFESWPRTSNNVTSTSPTAEKPIATQIIKVRIYPDRWSEWIWLPPSCNFQVDAPGWLEYCFIDGYRKTVEDKTTAWLGRIPNNTFRLRGYKGEVVITVETKTP